jgi:hypothetical protein
VAEQERARELREPRSPTGILEDDEFDGLLHAWVDGCWEDEFPFDDVL